MTASASSATTDDMLVRPDVSALLDLSLRGLRTMFDTQRGLFCYTLRQTAAGLRPEGHSERYSIMSVLGLHKLEQSQGGVVPVPVRDAARSLLRHRGWVDNIGDLGLLLWLCAAVTPDDLDTFVLEAGVGKALSTYPNVRRGMTMELSWMLTGVAYASRASARSLPASLTALGAAVYDRLVANQGPHGFFGHQATNAGVSGAIRGHIGSFADQVYPMYALARYGQYLQHDDAITRARRCADAACATQGPLGQWWWHFDARHGRVAQRLPVYAVHQEGMAPMALFAAAEASGHSYQRPIYLGLEWLVHNEVQRDLREPELGVVWRNIEYTQRWQRGLSAARDYLGSSVPTENSAGRLRVNEECRPYELGWLLYAFAGEPQGKSAHVV